MPDPEKIQSVLFSTIILLVLLPFQLTFAQSPNLTKIYGRITDASTGEPIPYVNVFLNSTTIGSATDLNGYYKIDKVPYGSFVLIISHIGYKLESKPLNIFNSRAIELNVELKPRVLQTKDVDVTAVDPEEWHDHLKIFLREFLGKGDFSDKCSILNPEVINFKVSGDSGGLSASSDSVIHVVNNALGYKLDIILKNFFFSTGKNRITYIVYPRFHEMEPSAAGDSARWKENRLNCYTGSFRNFMAAVYTGKVEENDFVIYTGNFQALVDGYGKYLSPEKLLVVSEVSSPLKKFYINGCYKVKYKGYMNTFSIMCPIKKYALIDRYGNVVNPVAVETAGAWTTARISDLLPDNYEPGHDK